MPTGPAADARRSLSPDGRRDPDAVTASRNPGRSKRGKHPEVLAVTFASDGSGDRVTTVSTSRGACARSVWSIPPLEKLMDWVAAKTHEARFARVKQVLEVQATVKPARASRGSLQRVAARSAATGRVPGPHGTSLRSAACAPWSPGRFPSRPGRRAAMAPSAQSVTLSIGSELGRGAHRRRSGRRIRRRSWRPELRPERGDLVGWAGNAGAC